MATKISIPQQLQNPNFRFLKIAMTGPSARKRPMEKDWVNKNNYRYNDSRLLKHISAGKNYGVVLGYGHLAVIDADSKIIEDLVETKLPETFIVRTGGGGKHYYYIIPDLRQKIILHDQQHNHYGEIQFTGSQVIGPGCIHPNGKRYEIIKDASIATIEYSLLENALGAYIQKNSTPPFHWEGNGNFCHLDITKVVDLSKLKKHGKEYQGSHPVHGSTTGYNFCVNPSKGIWHCFRCNTGGGALSLVAVLEKIIDCHEARPGALKGQRFKEVLETAREKYGLDVEIDVDSIEYPLQIKNQEYKVRFTYHKKKLFYSLVKDGNEGLQTEAPLHFFRDEKKRNQFYKNIALSLGVENKKEKKKLEKKLLRILEQLQRSEFLKNAFRKAMEVSKKEATQLNRKPAEAPTQQSKDRRKISLEDVYHTVEKWLGIKPEDRRRIDVVLATAMSNQISGTPIWLILVGASGDWKSTIVNSLESLPNAIKVDQITENTLISGMKNTRDLGQELQNSSHILLFPDLASLMSMRSEKKSVIWGQFRNLYDGFLCKKTGSGVNKRYEGCHVTLIACSTEAIRDEFLIHERLGTRELFYDTGSDPIDNERKMNMAVFNEQYENQMKREIGEIICGFLQQHTVKNIEISEETLAFLKREANRLVVLRATGVLDKFHFEVSFPVVPEVPTRIIKQFVRLYRCLRSLDDHYSDSKARRVIRHIVDSTGDPVRLKVWKTLEKAPAKWFKINEVQQLTRLSRKSVKGALEILWNIGVIEKKTEEERIGGYIYKDPTTNVEQERGGRIEEIAYYRYKAVTPHSTPQYKKNDVIYTYKAVTPNYTKDNKDNKDILYKEKNSSFIYWGVESGVTGSLLDGVNQNFNEKKIEELKEYCNRLSSNRIVNTYENLVFHFDKELVDYCIGKKIIILQGGSYVVS